MGPLTGGTHTFVLTDVEGSTRAWDSDASRMANSLEKLESIVESEVVARRGTVVKSRGEGDSSLSVFSSALDAVDAAATIQRRVAAESELLIRIGIHTGEVQYREGDYFGPTLNRAARLRSIAHGGQVVVSGSVADLVAGHLPVEVTLRDLGTHVLKDLERPERVFQLVAPGLRRDFPALKTLAPTRLPSPTTSFVGRTREVEEITGLLHTSRLVNLVGPGGSGKTRLALEVARKLSTDGPDEIVFIDLSPVSSDQLVADAVARAVNVRAAAADSLIEAIRVHFGGSGALLVIDNCEQVIAGVSDLLGQLLQAIPALKVLTTSRTVLHVQGEAVVRIGPLELEDAQQMFVDRARLTVVAAADLAAIHDVCAQLDGIPLAIELAAARTDVLSIAAIRDRLDERFALLTTGNRTASPRQRTLEAAVEWSYELLSDDEQDAFRLLGVFVGGFTLEAAARVLGADEIATINVLSALIDKSLLTREGDRYGMLETLRQFARARLNSDGADYDARARHANYYDEFISAAIERGMRRHSSFTHDLLPDLDNIRESLQFLRTESPNKLLETVVALEELWVSQLLLTEGVQWTQAALEAGAPDHALRTLALAKLAYMIALQGDTVRARSILESIGDASSRPATQRFALFVGALIELNEGNLEAARQDYQKLADTAPEPAARARAVNTLGILLLEAGEVDGAYERFEEALAISREEGVEEAIGNGLLNLGLVAVRRGQLSRATELLREAAPMLRGVPDVRLQLRVLSLAAELARATNDAFSCAVIDGYLARLVARSGLALRPAFRAEIDRRMAWAREQLGSGSYDVAAQRGSSATAEQVWDLLGLGWS